MPARPLKVTAIAERSYKDRADTCHAPLLLFNTC
jgi:hypothetical protein